MPNIVIDFKPSLTGENTDALVENQGYTYNQAGFTYNQVGVMYGGVYNTNQDIVPLVSLAETIMPMIAGYSDIYQPFIPDPDKGMLIAPGLPWQFLTYP